MTYANFSYIAFYKELKRSALSSKVLNVGLTIIISLLLISPLISQSCNFSTTIATPNNLSTLSVASIIDSDNNIISIGIQGANETGDLIIMKLDSTGNQIQDPQVISFQENYVFREFWGNRTHHLVEEINGDGYFIGATTTTGIIVLIRIDKTLQVVWVKEIEEMSQAARRMFITQMTYFDSELILLFSSNRLEATIATVDDNTQAITYGQTLANILPVKIIKTPGFLNPLGEYSIVGISDRGITVVLLDNNFNDLDHPQLHYTININLVHVITDALYFDSRIIMSGVYIGGDGFGTPEGFLFSLDSNDYDGPNSWCKSLTLTDPSGQTGTFVCLDLELGSDEIIGSGVSRPYAWDETGGIVSFNIQGELNSVHHLFVDNSINALQTYIPYDLSSISNQKYMISGNKISDALDGSKVGWISIVGSDGRFDNATCVQDYTAEPNTPCPGLSTDHSELDYYNSTFIDNSLLGVTLNSESSTQTFCYQECNIDDVPPTCLTDTISLIGNSLDGFELINFLDFVDDDSGIVSFVTGFDCNDESINQIQEFSCNSVDCAAVAYEDDNQNEATCFFYIEITCDSIITSNPSSFKKLIGNDLDEFVTKVESNSQYIYLLGGNGDTENRYLTLTKTTLEGDPVWEFSSELGVSPSNLYIKGSRIIISGLTTPFASGNNSVLIELEDVGSDFLVKKNEVLDFSSSREGFREITLLDDGNYALLVHDGLFSNDKSRIVIFNDSLNYVNQKNFGFLDLQLWFGIEKDLDNTITIFGEEAEDNEEGFIINTDYDLNLQRAISFFGIGEIREIAINFDDEIRIIGARNQLVIVDKDYEVLNSYSINSITNLIDLQGPFFEDNSEYYYMLSSKVINDFRRSVISKIQRDGSSLSINWSKYLTGNIDNTLGSSFRVLGIDTFLIAEGRIDSLQEFGAHDQLLSILDVDDCILQDVGISLQSISVDRVVQTVETRSTSIPTISLLEQLDVVPTLCFDYPECPIFYDSCQFELQTCLTNYNEIFSEAINVDFNNTSDLNYTWIINGVETSDFSPVFDTTIVDLSLTYEICLSISDGFCEYIECDTISGLSTLGAIEFIPIYSDTIINGCKGVLELEIPFAFWNLELNNDLLDGSICFLPFSQDVSVERSDNLSLSDTLSQGITTINFSSTAPNGVFGSYSFTVEVIDNTPPSLECLDQIISLDISGTSFMDINANGITIEDECGLESGFIVPELFTCQDLGQSQYNLVVTDINGNQASCLGNVLVIDEILPIVTCEDVIIEVGADGEYNFTIDDIDYLATDNCSIDQVQFDSILVDCFSNLSSYEIRVFDTSGNQLICTANVTITDNIPPAVICNELSITLNEQGFAVLDIDNSDVSAIDNCGAVNFTLEPNFFTCDDLGEVPYVLIATDLSNNVGSCQNLIIVEDALPEIVDCPVVEIYLDESGLAELTVDDIQAEISTNCSIVTLELISNTSFNCNNSIEVYELVATDSSNNSSTCSNLISVIDTFPPSITDCLELLVDLDTNGEANYSFSDIEVLVSDNCNNYSLEEIESGILFCEDPIRNYVVKVLDQSGIVSDSCSNLIVAVDNMVPICEVSDVFIDNPNDEDFIPAEFVINAIDNCAVADVSSDIQVGDLLECGTSNIVNVLVSDDTGNTTDCSFVITTGDCADIDCSANAEIVYQGCGQLIANANAFDFQNEVVFTWSLDQVIIQESLSNSFETVLELGTHLVCVVASDGICESQFCETVIVDDIAFEFNNCPVNQFIGDCDFTFDINSVTANSICNGEPAIIESIRSDGMPLDAVLPLGTTEFICQIDGAPNTTCVFSISIFDNSDPICNSIESVAIDVDNNGAAFVSISDLDLGSFDNCGEVSIVGDNIVILNCNIFSGVLSYEIEDESGQSSECFVIIDLIDNLPPICVLTETTVSLDQTGQGMIIVSDLDVGSSDNCGVYFYEPSEFIYTCDDIGSNTLSTNIVDQYGNASPCTTNVDVVSSDIPECNFNDLIVSIPESGNVIINSDLFMNTIQSDCGDIEIISEELILSCNDIGTSIVNVTLNGSFGTLDCEVNIILEDNITPICQSFTYDAFLDINGTVAIDINQLNIVAIDNCAVNLIEPSQSIFDCSQLGNNQSVVTVMDISGNSQDCSYTVTVIDDIQPLCEDFIIELQLDSFGVGTVDDILSVMDYYDNCGVLSVESNLNTFDCSDIGSNNIVLTLTDTNGNVSQCDASVVIIDQPFECNLPNLNISLDEDGLATFDLENMVEFISGGCSDYTFSTIPLTFNCEDLGDNEIVLDVFDGGVIIETCNAIVTVEDNLSPLCITESISIDADNSNGAIINLDVEVIDNCSLSDISYSIENGSFLDCGSYMLTATVIDERQNNTECMIQLDVTGCGSCCESEADFLSIASSEILLSSNFNMEENCLVTINKPNLSMCQYITEVIWGDETETRGMFSNETSIEHFYTSPGDYDICITYEEMSTNSDSCFNEQICEKFTLIDICEIKKSINSTTLETKLNVWPNPSSQIVNITLESRFFDVEINRLELYDTQGKLIYNYNEETKEELYKINLSDLDRGLYLLNATLTNGINLSHKIIKI